MTWHGLTVFLDLATFLLTRPSEILNDGSRSKVEQSYEEPQNPVKVIEDLIVLLLSIVKSRFLIHPFIHSFIHTFIHTFIYLFIHLFFHTIILFYVHSFDKV